jgi:hypothetical protein
VRLVLLSLVLVLAADNLVAASACLPRWNYRTGMTITYALMEKLEDLAEAHPDRPRCVRSNE